MDLMWRGEGGGEGGEGKEKQDKLNGNVSLLFMGVVLHNLDFAEGAHDAIRIDHMDRSLINRRF
jgi:hypothetical protein